MPAAKCDLITQIISLKMKWNYILFNIVDFFVHIFCMNDMNSNHLNDDDEQHTTQAAIFYSMLKFQILFIVHFFTKTNSYISQRLWLNSKIHMNQIISNMHGPCHVRSSPSHIVTQAMFKQTFAFFFCCCHKFWSFFLLFLFILWFTDENGS